jgi:Na+/H+ antiporter NhaA
MLPPLLRERTAGQEAVAVVVAPVVLGVVTGFFLGEQELVYLVLSLLALLGAFAAGLEHESAAEAAYRGLLGGLLFGVAVLVTHQVRDVPAAAELLEPESLLVVVTALFGAGLGALGGRVRAGRVRRGAATG